jgi:hypothetical protein
MVKYILSMITQNLLAWLPLFIDFKTNFNYALEIDVRTFKIKRFSK